MERSTGRIIGIFCVIAILTATLAGCAKNGETETAKNSSGETATSSTEPAKPLSSSISPPDALAQAMRTQLAAKSYRVRISSYPAAMQGETLVEYVAPDRIHMSNPLSELIAVGSVTYTRRGSGPWEKAPINAGEIARTFRDPKLIDQLTTNYDIKFVGQDTLEGAPMLVYEYTPKETSPSPKGGKTKVWISADNSLPRKVETQSAANPGVTTIIYSDYNSDIKIELPV
ncbi:MAG TPA: hypothetical protein VF131_09625 [Blastocatellia bacterium]|nr:hypothetical protein [Blastocatellia bacterium]